jgi:hypothetical protein
MKTGLPSASSLVRASPTVRVVSFQPRTRRNGSLSIGNAKPVILAIRFVSCSKMTMLNPRHNPDVSQTRTPLLTCQRSVRQRASQ